MQELSFSMVLFITTAFVARRLRCPSRRLFQRQVEAGEAVASHQPPDSLKEAYSLTPTQVESFRSNYISSSCSVSYKNTGGLQIVGGYGSRLIDVHGNEYLDTRNNVAHCGHGHPEIVEAITYQMKLLNTNSRYLHPIASLLSKELVNLFPQSSAASESLSKVFFVNSGSEANDLALRLARAYNQKQHSDSCVQRQSKSNQCIITIDHAYHGHTLSTLDVSPYKHHQGKEIKECPAHVKIVPFPCTYRGDHSNCKDETEASVKYSDYVKEACREITANGDSVSAFFMEGGMSVAGVILPPKSYISRCVKAVREVGGLYIADEVQTGFGRLGRCRWAFEYSNSGPYNDDEDKIIPDIVTVGKPFGNGVPLAAVITTPKVASAFEALGVEYFNTFAASPPCCAAGLSMLHVLSKYELQSHALRVGELLQKLFREVQVRQGWIGDVRGSGLFLGIELVRDKNLEPATEETSFVCSTLKEEHNILSSIDGYYNNVIVVKPPMVFSEDDAVQFVTCFEKCLTALPSIDKLRRLGKTPT